MPKTVPEADGALWQAAMRGVLPLRDRAAPVAAPPNDGAAPPPRGAAMPPASRALPQLPPLDRFAGIDRANAERLKRGMHAIEARLDLHGMTQAEAYPALAAFIERSRAGGRRCILIITGRGLGAERAGILRAAVPRWLEEAGLRRHLLAIAPAQPRHGGNGAIYLLLKRSRRAGS